MTALQQKLESVSSRFSCGDLLFDDSHPLSKVIVQKASLTCAMPIEKGYYNHHERGLKTKDVCYWCGALGSKDFLFGLTELQEKNMTDGYKCFPICQDCIACGKKPGTYGKPNAIQARKEKIAKAKK